MPFAHNQTFIGTSTFVKTNWSLAGTGSYTGRYTSPAGPTGARVFANTPQSYSYATNYMALNNNIAMAGNWDQYTIEGWFYVDIQWASQTDGVGSTYWITIGSAANNIKIMFAANDPTSQQYMGASATIAGTSYSISQNMTPWPARKTWTYYTLVKQSDSVRYMMINGQRVGNIMTTTINDVPDTTSGNAVYFGGGSSWTQRVVYLDQMRISNIARYGPNQVFTPPTTAFTNDVNTWYLSQFNTSYVPAASPT